ncbi:MAG: glycosyltransferase family 2 protein [Oscillospiraceae bacterium]
MDNRLYIVMPCYNEVEVLHETAKQVKAKLTALIAGQKIAENSRILFVDDGSKDKTWSIIESLCESDELFAGIKLAHNKGHQNALLAGLMTAKEKCDIAISMDADLQDDINAIDKMIEEYDDGSDIVYGVRSSRKKDTFFKRTTAQSFYKVMKSLGVDVIYNHADYRLMSRRALEGLAQYKEVNLFLRGIVPLIGYRYSIVEYERGERFAGESKYPLKKMLSFAFEGITSFSVKPIRIITVMGFIIFIISILALIYSLVVKFFGSTDIGWTSLICSIWMIGGIQLLSIGIIGEYVGKIYFETKARPKFIIEKELDR